MSCISLVHYNTNLLVAMYQHYAQLCGDQSPPTLHLHIVPGAYVLNVHRDAGVLHSECVCVCVCVYVCVCVCER